MTEKNRHIQTINASLNNAAERAARSIAFNTLEQVKAIPTNNSERARILIRIKEILVEYIEK